MLKQNSPIILTAVLILIVGSIFYLESQKQGPDGMIPSDIDVVLDSQRVLEKAQAFPLAKDISSPDGFINTDAITIEELIGDKIVLIDFWTYSCINCQRTTPYLNAWYEKYKDQGLEIIGVHTPEFEFEKEYENVLAAVEKFDIQYPVVLDNDFSTWQAYNNRYWPRKYLIDIDGFVVYDHIGEGGYDETEAEIQRLLAERSSILELNSTIDSSTAEVEVGSVDFSQVKSREVYFGSIRSTLGSTINNTNESFVYPEKFAQSTVYLDGSWSIGEEFASSVDSAKFKMFYDAKNVHMVASGDAVIRILVDGEDKGTIHVTAEQLYNLVLGQDYGEHELEIIVESGIIEIYTLTFG